MNAYRKPTKKITLILHCMTSLSLAADIKCLEPTCGVSRLHLGPQVLKPLLDGMYLRR